MGKYKNSSILQNAVDEENNQIQLRSKHNITDDNIVVVEKKSILKWIFLFFRVLFSILLVTLAATGIYALLEPTIRTPLIDGIHTVFNSIIQR